MLRLKKLVSAALTLALTAFTVVATGEAANAYATAPTLGSGATSSTIATNGLYGLSTGSTQKYSFDNAHGGFFEIGGTADNSKSITIRSYVDGALDTSFNGTGVVTFNGQLFNNTTSQWRINVELTTYASGTKWMVYEKNSTMSSGLNYIHLGTYAGGYQSTVTLPTGNSDYAACQSQLAVSTYTTLGYTVELIQNSPYTTPTYFFNCYVYLTSGGAGTSVVSFLADISGGTTLGTSGTHAVTARLSPVPTAGSHTFVRMGYSTNSSPTGTRPKIAAFYQLNSATTQISSPPSIYSTNSTYNDYVIRGIDSSGAVTQVTSAWTPATLLTRTGTFFIAPRNDGTLRGLTFVTDGTTTVAKVWSFAGVATGTGTTLTGTLPTYASELVTNLTPSTTTVKLVANDGTAVKGYEISASTGAVTAAGAFTTSSQAYDSFRWIPAATTLGIDTYSRTAVGTVTRVSLSSAPVAPSTPAAPTAVRGDTQATVSWVAPSNGGAAISAYTLDYSSDSGSTWTNFATSGTGTSATVTGLTNGTAYQFRVLATNTAGSSAYSAASTAVTPAAVAGAPTAVSGARSGADLALNWTAPASNGGSAITDYLIEYSGDSGATWSTFSHTASTTTSASLTGLTLGTTYVARISAINAVGTGAASALSSGVLVAVAPGTPTAVTGVRGDTEVSLSWNAPASTGGSGITSYSVQYSSDSGSTWSTYGIAPSTTSITVIGLANATAYIFKVSATNQIGTSAYSTVSAAVTPAALPGTPNLVALMPGANHVYLTWTAPASTGGFAITDYVIEYSSDSGSTWTAFAHAASTTTSITVTGLTNGTSYLLRVKAVTSVGTGLPSANSTPQLVAAAPGQVNTPTGTIGDTQVVLSWSAPLANGCAITAYTVDYSANAGSTWTNFSGAIASTSATVTGLTNGTGYVFRVAGINCMGAGAFSAASASITPNPVPAQPGALTVVGSGSQSVTLTWTAPTSVTPITDYLIEYSTDGGTTWQTYADGVSAAASATLTGLTVGANYSFRVSAISANGTSSASASPAGIAAASVPSAQAAAPTVTAGYNSASITWSAPSNDGGSAITGVDVQYSTDGGSTWQNYVGSVGLSGSATLTGFTAGQAYVVRTRTSNFFGTSAWSAASSSITALAPVAPAQVSGITAAPGTTAGTINLSWTAPSANGSAITDYTIEYSLDGGVTWTTYAHSASSATSIALTGLVPGGNYTFRVTAINGIGSSTVSTASAAVIAAAPNTAVDVSRLPTSIKVDRTVSAVANGAVTFNGGNLGNVNGVLMNGWESVITARTPESLTTKIPAEVTGWVSVEFVSKFGNIRYDKLIFVSETADVKAGNVRLRLGFQTLGLTTATAKPARAVSTSAIALRSLDRLATVRGKVGSISAVTCIGYVAKGASTKDALQRARTSCNLVTKGFPAATVKLAVTRSNLHAHVLVLIQK